MNNTIAKGIEQGRASFAYQKALEGQQKGVEDSKKYKSYVRKMPMMIKTNGLGATLAFYFSKDVMHKFVYEQIYEWLVSHQQLLTSKDSTAFVKEVVELNSQEYRMVTTEVMALLNWMRRFAEGLIEGEAS